VIHPDTKANMESWNERFRPYQTAAIMSRTAPIRIGDLCIWVGCDDRDTVKGNARLFGIRIKEE
jgi:hypothetical protein